MTYLNIGQIAKRTGVTVEAIRFYEKQALLPEPRRSASGYRQYLPETAKRVRFIQRAKELGFSLKEVNALLSLRDTQDGSCADVKVQALQKVSEIEQKIRDLNRIRDALTELAEKCGGRGDLSECPILDALDEIEDFADGSS